MKITEQQLKQIIKEEVEKALNESQWGSVADAAAVKLGYSDGADLAALYIKLYGPIRNDKGDVIGGRVSWSHPAPHQAAAWSYTNPKRGEDPLPVQPKRLVLQALAKKKR
tara:strand:+ start:56 stop:385 length:330 start_codon:yes stop_codon:yes gene_type:complete